MEAFRPEMSWTSLAAVVAATPIVLIGGALVVQATRTCYLLWKWRAIPGPRPNLIFGNLATIRKAGGNHRAVAAWYREYGPVFKVFFLAQVWVVVMEPEAAQKVMNRCINHARFGSPTFRLMRGDMKRIDEDGLLQSRDSLWRVLRSTWQPAFAPASLQGYVQLMQSCASRLGTMLTPSKGMANGAAAGPKAGSVPTGSWPAEYVDIHELLSQMTLDVVGTTAYGVEFDALAGDQASGPEPAPLPPAVTPAPASSGTRQAGSVLCRSCKQWFVSTTMQGATSWGLVYLALPDLLPLIRRLASTFPDEKYTRMMKARHDIADTSYALMHDWRTSHPDTSSANGRTAAAPSLSADLASRRPGQGVAPGSFLGLVLDAQQRLGKGPTEERLPDLTIAAQCATFFLAGTETTANTLAFTVYLLATHPDVEAQLVEELRTHGLDQPVGSDAQLPWTDAIINEALRLYPPAHTTTREIGAPEGMTVLGYHLPQGMNVMLPLYGLQHIPSVWPRADEFLPQRWLKQHQAELGPSHPAAYCPFGGGPRQCPGAKFALQEARIALALLYSKYTFELAPGQVPLQISAGLTLSPKGGLRVRPVPRSAAPA